MLCLKKRLEPALGWGEQVAVAKHLNVQRTLLALVLGGFCLPGGLGGLEEGQDVSGRGMV